MTNPPNQRLTRPVLLALLAFCGWLPNAAARAQDLSNDPALATAMTGGYQLASVTGGRQCRFQLGAERAEGGYRLFFPVGCRTAFPFLRAAQSWSLDAAGNLVFNGPKQVSLALFVLAAPNYLELRDASGTGTHQVTPDDPGWYARRQSIAALPDAPAKADPAKPAAAIEPPKPAAPETPAAMEGWYQVVRANGQLSECRMALLSAEAVETGSKAAALDEKCADPGMKIFSPKAWRMEAGALIITARKGHELAMAPLPGGGWTKAVPSGEELILQKLD
jgi:hypothetical protein